MRLVAAEILKLRRRRGTMIWTALLTIGSVLITVIILVALHAANPGKHGPAGGAENLKNLALLLGGLGTVAAILIGSTAGTQDVSAGVFRDLVVTGRPRRTLFAVRYPGALAVFGSLLVVAYAICVVIAYAFAGYRPNPTGSDVGHYAAYLALIGAVNIGVAIGLAAFASSRVVVGVLIAWNAFVSHLLISIHSLGGARKFIDVAAAQHFLPRGVDDSQQVVMSPVTALFVLAAWVLVFQAAGRWWTERRDA